MFQKPRRYAFALITLVLYCHEASADEALMDGVRPFICDGQAIVFVETDNGWEMPTDPTAEIQATDNGWRFEDTLGGSVWYLREESRSSWVIDGVSENGHLKIDCIDAAYSVSQVVTIIKPRLDEGILDAQAQFSERKEDFSIAVKRVERLCTWMKTYQHLDVLDKKFVFQGAQYQLCD